MPIDYSVGVGDSKEKGQSVSLQTLWNMGAPKL